MSSLAKEVPVPTGQFPHVDEGGKAADAVRNLIALESVQMSAASGAFVAVFWEAGDWLWS